MLDAPWIAPEEEAAPRPTAAWPPAALLANVAGEVGWASPLLADDEDRDLARRVRWIAQVLCAFVLMLSCCASAGLILSEAVQGVRRSFYCSLGKDERLAPAYCVVPLASAAVLCHLAVVAGLGCIGHFAWLACSQSCSRTWHPEEQRTRLRNSLKVWQNYVHKVLLAATIVYLLAGPACAGLARMAFIFLATGFLTLYATMLFFDDDVDQASVPPRFLRFLGVYTLVGVTFTFYSWGFLEKLGLDNSAEKGDNATSANETENVFNTTEVAARVVAVCTASGQAQISPARCTVPLDFASGISLWWVASPLFANLVGAAGGKLRKILKRWRRRVDVFVLSGILLLTAILRDECKVSSPIAFFFAQMSAYAVLVLLLLRRLHPMACDAWRGPLEHLVTVAAPTLADPADPDAAQCSICLGELQGEVVSRAPCGHEFHLECLEEWVIITAAASPSCPLCRESLLPSEPTC